MSTQELQLRSDLAACFRLVAALGMHEAVANHFSAAVSEDGKKFLINPKWVHFSQITPESLLLLDADNPEDALREEVDATAWAIHGQIHQRRPDIRAVLHLHPIYTTTLACLEDPRVLPIDQTTARYFNRIAYDKEYGGMADSEAEGARLVAVLGDHQRLLMGNHGVMITAKTIGEAFDDIYTLERACTFLVKAYSTGQPLRILSDEIAEKTAQGWESIVDFSLAHFEQMKNMLLKDGHNFSGLRK